MIRPKTLGLILAGGLARRMGGGDKALIEIGGRTILDRVIETMTPQCDALVLNANGDPSRFANFGLTVIPDDVPDFAGPLAGILAGLDWAATNRPDIEWMASVPGDCPFLPADLVEGCMWRASMRTCRLHAQNQEIGGIPWPDFGP